MWFLKRDAINFLIEFGSLTSHPSKKLKSIWQSKINYSFEMNVEAWFWNRFSYLVLPLVFGSQQSKLRKCLQNYQIGPCCTNFKSFLWKHVKLDLVFTLMILNRGFEPRDWFDFVEHLHHVLMKHRWSFANFSDWTSP